MSAVAGAGNSHRSVRGSGWYVRDSPKPGKALGHHLLRNSILADGELSAREAEHVVWDGIVVGTGMGGGTLGYWLAPAGGRGGVVGRGGRTLPRGGGDAGLLAGPVRPQGAVRREGALDTARGAGDDSLFDAGTRRAAGGPFR